MVLTDSAKKILSKSYDLCLRYNQICEGGVHVDISTHRQEWVKTRSFALYWLAITPPKKGSKSNKWGSFTKFRKFLARGTEFFKIVEEMVGTNEAGDGNSILCYLMSQKGKFCFLLYQKEIYAQFVETYRLVKHNIYQELKQTITDLDLRITWKHPVYYYYYITIILFISIISPK